METQLNKTPLYEEHIKLNAKMGEFGGYIMPIQYSGILNEHKHCRTKVALFDICHMGEFYFKGDFEKSNLERLISISISKIPIGKCKYGFLLKEDAGIIDDMIIYKLSDNEIMIVINSETTLKDYNYIKNNLTGNYLFENISDKTAKLDLQGPLSRDVLVNIFGERIKELKYFSFDRFNFKDLNILISRTGYTGELGYELYFDNQKAKDIWNLLLSNTNVIPAGLGARDILRLEMGYSLYGSDIDENTTPVEADLLSFVDLEKPSFNGKDIILKQKQNLTTKKRIAFVCNSRKSPRHNYKIYYENKEIGIVSSGVFSPIISCGIGMGYIKPEFAINNNKIIIKSENTEIEAIITTPPFYKDSSLRK